MTKYNYLAFFQRFTVAIEKNLNTNKRNDILRKACELLQRFDKYQQQATIADWAKKFKLSISLLNAFLRNDEEKKLTPLEELRQYLSLYSIQYNEITGQYTIALDGVEYTIEELELDVEHFKAARHLKKLINPVNKNITITTTFNPIKDFFYELAKNYNGEPVIQNLATCMTAYNFDDETKTIHYQERLAYYLHKWLCKAAGQVLGIAANDAMLMLCEPFGGSGKSYVINWLFSLPEFQDYYLKIGENESFIDLKGIGRGKIAINWDELPLSKKRYLAFKSNIATQNIQAYNKKTQKYESHIRSVNYIGSSNLTNRNNQRGFLLDNDMAIMRRIIPIELLGRIDYVRYLKEIDLRQLWGQAASTILLAQKNKTTKLLTWENDYEDLRFENKKYTNVNSIGGIQNEILRKFKAAQRDNGVVLQPKEILQKLQDAQSSLNITISKSELTKVGFFLSKNGYIPGRTKNGSAGYWIQSLN